MSGYNVVTQQRVETDEGPKYYEIGFASTAAQGNDMRKRNAPNLGLLLESNPEVFADEDGNPLEAGKVYEVGYLPQEPNAEIRAKVIKIGASSTRTTAYMTRIVNGEKVRIPIPHAAASAQPTANGGRIPR